MKTEDLNALKGKMKDAAVKWSHQQIDGLFPEQPKARALLKNGAANLIGRWDAEVNKGLDMAFVLFGDQSGTIDSDTMVDMVLDMLQEMPQQSYEFGPFALTAGKGEVAVRWERSFVVDMLTGGMDGVRFTRADFAEIKNLII